MAQSSDQSFDLDDAEEELRRKILAAVAALREADPQTLYACFDELRRLLSPPGGWGRTADDRSEDLCMRIAEAACELRKVDPQALADCVEVLQRGTPSSRRAALRRQFKELRQEVAELRQEVAELRRHLVVQ